MELPSVEGKRDLAAAGILKEPRVAVLMSVIDREREDYLDAAVTSILQQTYPHTDLWIGISGAIRPALRAVLDKHAGSRLYTVDEPDRQPLAVSLNGLITLAGPCYTYFARMDSDDESLPDRIARQVARLDANPELDVLGGAIMEVDAAGRELTTVSYPTEHEAIVRFFRRRNPIAHVTAMFRKTYFEKAGLYPPIPFEDGLYWMQGIAAQCRFGNLSDVLVRVRRTDEFLLRRSGLRTNLIELRIRRTINRTLGFGPLADAYGLATFAAQMMPLPIKRFLYDRCR